MKTSQETATLPPDVRLIPLPEAARRLGLSYGQAWLKTKQGAIPAVQMKYGGRLYVRSDLLDMLIVSGSCDHEG